MGTRRRHDVNEFIHSAHQMGTMSYKAGIITAITELKDRTGSSSIAIKKHMQANLPKDKKWLNGMFLNALKKAVAYGDLTQIKASYKLSPDYKKKAAAALKPKKPKAPKKKAAPKKKKATKKKTAPKKKAATKKKTATKKKVATKKKTSTKKKATKKVATKK